MVLNLVHLPAIALAQARRAGLDLEFGPKIELIFILRGTQNWHECLFRPALARHCLNTLWSLQYFATEVEKYMPCKPGLGQGFRASDFEFKSSSTLLNRKTLAQT